MSSPVTRIGLSAIATGVRRATLGYHDRMHPALLIIFGLVLVALGVLWPLIAKLGLGRLPGDIVIERENFRLYIPLATSLVTSVVLSVLLWVLGR